MSPVHQQSTIGARLRLARTGSLHAVTALPDARSATLPGLDLQVDRPVVVRPDQPGGGEDRQRVLLVCSSGGHLAQLHTLKAWWTQHERLWVTFPLEDATSLLKAERTRWAHFPTTRNLPNLVRNSVLAVKVLREFRPDVIVSSGAAVAVPFFWLGKLLRIPTVYLEVFDRVDSATLTGKLCHPVTDLFLVQLEQQTALYGKATVGGPLF